MRVWKLGGSAVVVSAVMALVSAAPSQATPIATSAKSAHSSHAPSPANAKAITAKDTRNGAIQNAVFHPDAGSRLHSRHGL